MEYHDPYELAEGYADRDVCECGLEGLGGVVLHCLHMVSDAGEDADVEEEGGLEDIVVESLVDAATEPRYDGNAGKEGGHCH